MSLISLVITIVVIGFLLWLVTTYVPMDATIKKAVVIVVIVCVALWLLQAFGLLDRVHDIRVPRIN